MNPLGDSIVRRGAIAVFAGLGGFLAWASLVPLDEGVTAPGVVVVEADRQAVQHLEGGIVQDLRVREGDIVEAGTILMRLDTDVSGAERSALTRDLLAQEAALLRLDAMAAGKTDADFSALRERAEDAESIAAIDREQAAMRRLAEAFVDEQRLLDARIAGLSNTISSKQSELSAQARAIGAAQEERDLADRLVDAQLGTRDRLAAVRGNLAGLEAQRAANRTEIARLRSDIADLRQQQALAASTYRKEAASEGLAMRREVEALRARLVAADDATSRGIIRAPQGGKVINLTAHTVGGVVRPGEKILEIVPSGSEVLGEVRLPAQARNHVYEGLTVRASLTSYRGWRAEPLPGRVVNVSGDLKTDEVTGERFYEAVVELQREGDAANIEVLPGMPLQAFIFSGESRTTLDYLFAPLTESFWRASRSR